MSVLVFSRAIKISVGFNLPTTPPLIDLSVIVFCRSNHNIYCIYPLDKYYFRYFGYGNFDLDNSVFLFS